MNDGDLMPDCDQCAALCCTHLALDAGPAFAIDKPAGARCPHLTTGDLCDIYGQRAQRGFAGCVNYTCYGAGQRVTGAFAAEDERAAAFPLVRDLHELAWLVARVRALVGDAPVAASLERAARDLETARRSSTVDALAAALSALRPAIARLLRQAGEASRATTSVARLAPARSTSGTERP